MLWTMSVASRYIDVTDNVGCGTHDRDDTWEGRCWLHRTVVTMFGRARCYAGSEGLILRRLGDIAPVGTA